MSCSPFDLRDYLFGELVEDQRRQVDLHVRACSGCHEDLERLRATHSTLLALRDEEVPQRIGFVSDKVFEPSLGRRAWQAFWGSSAKVGFAAASMLSAALLTITFFRPAAPVPAGTPAALVDTAKIEALVAERVHAAVRSAVADSEAGQARKTAELLAAAERRYQAQRMEDMLKVNESFTMLQKRMNVRESLMARYDPREMK